MVKSGKSPGPGMDKQQYEKFLNEAMVNPPGIECILEALQSYEGPQEKWTSDDQRLAFLTHQAILVHEPPQDRNAMLQMFGVLKQQARKLNSGCSVSYSPDVPAEKSIMLAAADTQKYQWVGALIEAVPGQAIPALMGYASHINAWLNSPQAQERQKHMLWTWNMLHIRKTKPRKRTSTSNVAYFNDKAVVRNVIRIMNAYPQAIENTTPQDRKLLLAWLDCLEDVHPTPFGGKEKAEQAKAMLLTADVHEKLSKVSKKARRGVKHKAAAGVARPSKPKM